MPRTLIRSFVAIFAAAQMLSASATSSEAVQTRVTDPSYSALFQEVWRTVNENFYDPNFHGMNWRAIGDRYRRQVASIRDDAAFSHLANTMLGGLHVSHLFLNPPSRDQSLGVGIGVTTETLGEDLVVIEVAPLSDAQRQGVRVGDRILSPRRALYGPLGDTTTLEVRGCDGAQRTLTVRHEESSWPPQHPAFEWRQIAVRPGETVGYIHIDRFDDGAAELADRALDELKTTQGIIIDVRGGGGGNLSSLRLISYFSGPSKRAVALLARPYLAALGHPVTRTDIDGLSATRGAYTNAAIFQAIRDGHGAALYATEDMGPRRYQGSVVVVMGNRTGSAGEGFAAAMREYAGAKLVGRPTMGYVLSSDRFTLSGGWVLTIPVDGIWGPDGRDLGDVPTQPDVLVPRTAADLCLANDPDLARAMDVLDAQLSSRPTPAR